MNKPERVEPMPASLRARREAIARSQPSETGCTPRVRRLNAALVCTPYTLCLHRARAYTEVFSQTEGEPSETRFAKAFARTLQELPASINEGELLVGVPTCRVRAVTFFPEIAASWFRNEIDALGKREWDPYEITPSQAGEVRKLLPYWQGRTLFDLWAKSCPPEIVAKVNGKGWANINVGVATNGFHFTPPWEAILASGLESFEQRARAALARVDDTNARDLGKRAFYESLLIVVQAVREFALKYSARAEALAAAEPDSGRRAELLAIAGHLKQVPYRGARSFHEALQSLSFMMTVLHIEGTGPAYTPGRIDQYLYPFFKADLEKGVIDLARAQEIIECLFIKLTANLMLYPAESARSAPGYKQVQTISLGGVNSLGKDASNELSYLFLEAAASVRTIQPDIVLLCHPRETPYALKKKAAEVNALGLGMPKLINTETLKVQLVNMGYTLDEASIGWVRGCTDPNGPGDKQFGHVAFTVLNVVLALECVLFNGRKRTPGQPGSGELLGLETGDCRSFADFPSFLQAFKKQLALQIRDGQIAANWAQAIQAKHFPVALQSLLTEACIERGCSANAGGALINIGPGMVISGGLATVADSLAAIRKLVYEDKLVSLDELVRAVDADFEGFETLRRQLLNKAPKYGNDIDYVDDLAREVFKFVNDEVGRHQSFLGNRNVAATNFPVSNILQGARTWATPDGRKAGRPLSNHAGPTEGMDVNGASANINSLTKLNFDKHMGCIHNMYFVNVDDEEKLNNMIDLADHFFSRGGYHLQINCQDKAVFMDAQKHPEKYRGLMVRVAGYVAYFVDLPRELQNEVIRRTSHYV